MEVLCIFTGEWTDQCDEPIPGPAFGDTCNVIAVVPHPICTNMRVYRLQEFGLKYGYNAVHFVTMEKVEEEVKEEVAVV